MKPLILG